MTFEAKEVLDVFSSKASTWETKARLISKKSGETRRLYHMLRRLIKQGDTLLDIGCGTGKVTKHISACYPNTNLISADISLTMIKKLHKNDANNFRVVMDGSNCCFLEEIFDIVTAQQFLHHTESPVDVIKEIHRVTKKNGRLLLLTVGERYHADIFPYHQVGLRNDLLGRASGNELIELLENNKFRVEEMTHDFFQFEFSSFENYFDFILAIGILNKIFLYKNIPTSAKLDLKEKTLNTSQKNDHDLMCLKGHYITVMARKT